MRNKITYLSLVLLSFLGLFLVSCTGKNPEPNYLTDEELIQIIKGFDSVSYYDSYEYEGKFNYFAEKSLDEWDNQMFPDEIEGERDLNDSLEKYSEECASYFLELPLHITYQNWHNEELDPFYKRPLATKYRLESSLFNSDKVVVDNIYYYKREGGGFVAKGFAVNHVLFIKNPTEIEAHAKWNFAMEYDENGYLIREKFETINASVKNKKDCIYADVVYKYY